MIVGGESRQGSEAKEFRLEWARENCGWGVRKTRVLRVSSSRSGPMPRSPAAVNGKGDHGDDSSCPLA